MPRSLHVGGHLAFGPDGMLYVSVGDGDDQGNPDNSAQLSGTRTVTASAEQFSWGLPGAAAAKGATLAGNSTQAASFGYESGAAMVGLSAPARRVGLFPSNTTATALTTDGWRLFDAAITWADG